MGEVLNEAIFEIAEELCEGMGLCIPAPELVKVAGISMQLQYGVCRIVRGAKHYCAPSTRAPVSYTHLTLPTILLV